jgi:hypothetical protein
VTQARSALCHAARLWIAPAIAAQQRLQGALAGFAQLATQILAFQLDLIEGAYDRGRAGMSVFSAALGSFQVKSSRTSG